MRLFVAFSMLCAVSLPAAAQSRNGAAPQDDCPQGRVIRQKQGIYPQTMTDCQVLDADTAVENDKLRKKAAMPRQPPKPPVARAVPEALPAPVAAQPAVVPEPLRTDYSDRTIGKWLVSAKQDRFGDGGAFTAFTEDGAIGFGVRCLQKTLSIGIIQLGADPKPMGKGDLFKIKFRIDAQPVVDSAGVAISDRLIQVVTAQSLVKSIRDGKETAIRIEDILGVTSTHIFDTNGARKAFADLSRDCPID